MDIIHISSYICHTYYIYNKLISKTAVKWKALCSASILLTRLSASLSLRTQPVFSDWKEEFLRNSERKGKEKSGEGGREKIPRPHIPWQQNLPVIPKSSVRTIKFMHASCDRAEIQLAWGRDSGGRGHEQHGLREPEDPGKALGVPWSAMARTSASVAAQLLREWRLKIHKVLKIHKTAIQNPTSDSMDRCVLNRSVMSYSLRCQGL